MSAFEDQDPDDPFDAYTYVASSEGEDRPLRSLPTLAAQAVAFAYRASPRLLWLTVALQLVAGATLAAQVYLGKLALDAVLAQADSGSIGPVIAPLAGLAAATAVGTVAAAALVQIQRLLGEYVQRLTWTRILDVTTVVPLETFEDPTFFDALRRIEANALLRPLTMAEGLVALASGLIATASLSTALIIIEPLLVPVLILGGLPMWLISRATGTVEFAFDADQTPSLRMRRYLEELLTGRNEAKEVRAFALGPTVYERWTANYAAYVRDFGHLIRRRLVLAMAAAAVSTTTLLVTLGLLVYLVVDGALAIGTAGAAILTIRLLSGRLEQALTGVGDLYESALFLRDFDEFTALADTPGTQAPSTTPTNEGVAPFGELTLEGVGFRYPGSERDALHDISMQLRAGEVVALVGENGSGKTTLAKLIGQLYSPQTGTVRWDDTDTAELDPDALRAHVGTIFQDFERFQLSARENIGFGRVAQMADHAAIEQAARTTGAHGLIAGLPHGYDTGLGKEYRGGYDLSLGQWQRVALARAFFRDAALLILDEPTASLDARAEHELFEQVRALARDRCLLLISHRFGSVRDADRIYVLHHGQIVESGSHDTLVADGGRYAEMFALQAEKYR